MARILPVGILVCLATTAFAEDFAVYKEHPRLLLQPQRLRLLRRERERTSVRWQQFEALMKGGVRMPEPGFASALYYRVSDDPAAGRAAVEWALGPGADLRQLALVFDWCQPLLNERQSAALAAKLRQAIQRTEAAAGVSAARSRALAAIALSGHVPDIPERELRRLVQQWWQEDVIAALKNGRGAIPPEETYALLEFLHAMRDNLNADLRESFPAWFRDLPIEHLLSYYPALYETGHGDYRVPARRGFKAPDWKLAELSRAAGLAMVAYDTNAVEGQYLQGWLMHDAFLMNSPAGIPYEFLWANPYQPGLSYYNAPLSLHDTALGRLFLRSSWDDDAVWAGYFDGELQLFENGQPRAVLPRSAVVPIRVGDTAIVHAASLAKMKIDGAKTRRLFVIGLKPRQKYMIQMEDEDATEVTADAAGIIETPCPQRSDIELRISSK